MACIKKVESAVGHRILTKRGFSKDKVDNCFLENIADTSKRSPVSPKILYYNVSQGALKYLDFKHINLVESLLP